MHCAAPPECQQDPLRAAAGITDVSDLFSRDGLSIRAAARVRMALLPGTNGRCLDKGQSRSLLARAGEIVRGRCVSFCRKKEALNTEHTKNHGAARSGFPGEQRCSERPG